MRIAAIAFGLAFVLIATCSLSAEEAKAKPKAKSLFDGKTLENFEIPQFGGEGAVEVKDGVISMGQGAMLTGITYKRDDFPKINYELTWEARRTMGIDFFAAATFPVKDSHCSFIPGGWGGAVVGLSNIDGVDASENETTTYIAFKDDQWYQFKVRVTDKKIEAWIDDKKVIATNIEGKKISTRNEVDLSHPMGIAAWQSAAEIRKIVLRELGK